MAASVSKQALVLEQAAQGSGPPDLRMQYLRQIQANHEVSAAAGHALLQSAGAQQDQPGHWGPLPGALQDWGFPKMRFPQSLTSGPRGQLAHSSL